jgi:hypothetical protein
MGEGGEAWVRGSCALQSLAGWRCVLAGVAGGVCSGARGLGVEGSALCT